MVSIILCTKRCQLLERAVGNFLEQTYPEKELVVVLNDDSMDLGDWQRCLSIYKNIHVFQVDEAETLGDCLNFGIGQARYPIIAKMDDDDYYSPDYLASSIQVFQETGASVVGKAAIFVYFWEERLLGLFRPGMEQRFLKNNRVFLAGGTLVFPKKVWEQVPFQSLNSGEDVQFQRDCLDRGLKIFSGDVFDYVLFRYGEDHQHSWQVGDELFQKQCRRIAVTDSVVEFVSRAGGHEAEISMKGTIKGGSAESGKSGKSGKGEEA